MGLDGTIKRLDGKPLGNSKEIQRALATAFPGIKLGLLPSGLDKIRAAKENGIEFPDFLVKQLESIPSRFGGEYECEGFSIEFFCEIEEPIRLVNIVLRGNTVDSEEKFAILKKKFGWVVTHP